jgi:hypothetical protein
MLFSYGVENHIILEPISSISLQELKKHENSDVCIISQNMPNQFNALLEENNNNKISRVAM